MRAKNPPSPKKGAIRLPLRADAQVLISGQSEALQSFLQPVGDAIMTLRLGEERMKTTEGPLQTKAGPAFLIFTEGERFKGGNVTVQGGRVLLTTPMNPLGDFEPALAALNWTKLGSEVFVSNICVQPHLRRMGLGSMLIEQAMKVFPKLKADGNMTLDGAAFMGHSKPDLSSRANTALKVIDVAARALQAPTAKVQQLSRRAYGI